MVQRTKKARLRSAHQSVTSLLLAIGVIGALLSEAIGQDRTSHLRTEIAVQLDGSFEVTEALEVYLDKKAGRPFTKTVIPARRNHDPANPTYDYKVISVSRDAKSIPFRVTNENSIFRIHIEDPDYLPGRRIYRVQYRITGYVIFGTELDELIWVARPKSQSPLEQLDLTISFHKQTQIKRIDVFGKNGLDPHVLKTVSGTGSSLTLRSQRQINSDEQITVIFAWPHGVTADPALTKCAELLATTHKIPRSILKQSFHSLSSPVPFTEIICKFQAQGFGIHYSAPGWFSSVHELRVGDVQLSFAPVQLLPNGGVEKASDENPNARLAIFHFKHRNRSEKAQDTWVGLSSFTEASLLLVHLQGTVPPF